MRTDSLVRKTFANLPFVLISQLVVLGLGVFKSVILPKFWSVESFGYWQLYLFYCAYVGLFSLGFNDGIYLRYGKYSYDALPLRRLRTAIRLFLLGLICCSVVVALLVFWERDPERRFVFWAVCINILLMCLNAVLIFVMQITNQIKKYSFFSIIDKCLLLFGIGLVMFLNDKNYKVVVGIDILAKLVVVVCMMVACKALFWGEGCPMSSARRELLTDMRIGFKLMVANLMGMLILGASRIMVEWLGDIREYAFYSFGIAATNLIFIFISAVSLVIYPMLKRLPEQNVGIYYDRINRGICFFNFGILALYFPVCFFISFYLPQYAPVFEYLNLLFCLIVIQGKVALLNNTFYKTMREERAMLRDNMSCVLFFLIIVPGWYWYTGEIRTIAWGALLTMGLRCYLSEFFLRRKMGNVRESCWFVEILMLCLFLVISGVWKSPWVGLGIYSGILLIYLIYAKRDVKDFIAAIRRIYV